MMVDRIKQLVSKSVLPSGESYLSLSIAAEKKLADEFKKSRRQIELSALENGIIPERYIRNIGTIGIQGQIALLNATVGVVGAGGLGGTIIELLARMGTGKLIVVDGDEFSDNNLNRQIFAYEHNIGQNKAIIAAKTVHEINGAVEVAAYPQYITNENAYNILEHTDVIVDALDNMSARFLIERIAEKKQVPLIHGAIGGYCGHVTTLIPDHHEGLSGIYGNPEEVLEKGIEVQTGNPSATPLMIAAWQVHEVVKCITKMGLSLTDKLLYMDAEENMIQTLELL